MNLRNYILSGLIGLAGCTTQLSVKPVSIRIDNIQLSDFGRASSDSYVFFGIGKESPIYNVLEEYDKLMEKDGFILQGTNCDSRVWIHAKPTNLMREDLKDRKHYEELLNEFSAFLNSNN